MQNELIFQFKHASIGEKSLLWMGFLLGSLNGCIMPFIIAFYGEYTTLLIDRNTPNKTTVTPTIITTWFGGGRP